MPREALFFVSFYAFFYSVLMFRGNGGRCLGGNGEGDCGIPCVTINAFYCFTLVTAFILSLEVHATLLFRDCEGL